MFIIFKYKIIRIVIFSLLVNVYVTICIIFFSFKVIVDNIIYIYIKLYKFKLLKLFYFLNI